MHGRTYAALVAAAIGVTGAIAPAAWAGGDEVRIPLESCEASEADAHGDAEYRDDGGRQELRFDIDDLTLARVGEEFSVSVDGNDVGTMEIVENEDEPGEAEGTLRFRSDDGDQPPTTLDGDETVEIEDSGGTVIVSSECEGFDDSDSDGSGGSGSGSGDGSGSGGGSGVGGLLQSLLGLLGL